MIHRFSNIETDIDQNGHSKISKNMSHLTSRYKNQKRLSNFITVNTYLHHQHTGYHWLASAINHLLSFVSLTEFQSAPGSAAVILQDRASACLDSRNSCCRRCLGSWPPFLFRPPCPKGFRANLSRLCQVDRAGSSKPSAPDGISTAA